MNILKTTLVSGLVALTLTTPAYAQDSGTNGQVYEPAYFTQYAPRTALDMVSKIPGFQINEADSKRGLGNGGANILINGARIAGKSNPFDRLAAITAPNVVSIKIVDGASLDIPGLSGQVANITTNNTGVSGTWNWRPQFRKNLEANLFNGAVAVSGETGNLSYSVSLKSNAFRGGTNGPEQRFTPDGQVFETRDEDGQFYGDIPGISTTLTWKPKEDHIGNLNAEFNLFNFNGRVRSQHAAFGARGDNSQTLFSNGEDEWNAEIGGDYEFPLGAKHLNGKLKLIGFFSTEHSPSESRFDVFDPALGQTSGSRFARASDEGETIARAEYSWSQTQGRDWQFGVEGAFNYLDITSRLFLFNSANNNFEEDLSLTGATSRVEEKRTEATLTHTRTLSPKWDVQLSTGVEYSQISQTGGLVREFIRPKGFVSTTYKPNEDLIIRTKIERQVGQLNFSDFISSLSLQDNLNTAGNVNLVPEQKWLGEIEFDKDLGQGNNFKARFYGELISDLVDRIPIGIDGDAVGNIDSAQRYGVDFALTLKGEKWGYNGTQLDMFLDLRHSSVEDPVEFFTRRLNGDKKSFWRVNFRHDIPKTDWAYGFSINKFNPAPVFRITSIGIDTHSAPTTSFFIEHKNIFGLKVNAELFNLLGETEDFKQDVFTNRRDIGVLDFTENKIGNFGQIISINISGTF